MSAASLFYGPIYLFVYLVGRAVFEGGFLAYPTHHSFTRTHFAFAQVGIAFCVGIPIDGLYWIASKQVKVDMRTTIMQYVEFAPTSDSVQDF